MNNNSQLEFQGPFQTIHKLSLLKSFQAPQSFQVSTKTSLPSLHIASGRRIPPLQCSSPHFLTSFLHSRNIFLIKYDFYHPKVSNKSFLYQCDFSQLKVGNKSFLYQFDFSHTKFGKKSLENNKTK